MKQIYHPFIPALAAALALPLAFTACGSGDDDGASVATHGKSVFARVGDTSSNEPEQVVYVAGHQGDENNAHLMVWKNGAALATQQNPFSYAESVFVAGNKDVYAAGYQYEGGTYRAKYWKNGLDQPLVNRNSVPCSQAYSINFSSGNNAYVVGYQSSGVTNPNASGATRPDTGIGTHRAALWYNGGASIMLNGTATNSGTDTTNNVSQALSIFYSNTYTSGYICGYMADAVSDEKPYDPDTERAWVWRRNANGNTNNNDRIPMSDGRSRANSIYLDGATFYVAGYQIGGYQSDGTYVNDGKYRARLWTSAGGTSYPGNSSVQYIPAVSPSLFGADRLTEGESYAYSVFALDGKIYVAGQQGSGANSRAVVWEDGVARQLDSGESCAYSVYVLNGDVYVSGRKGSGNDVRMTLWKNGIAQ